MLELSAEVSVSRSAAVTRKVLPQRDAQQRSRQGEWRPAGIVRTTPGRPLPARVIERQDLLGVRDACPCQFRARYAIQIAFGWVPGDGARAGTHLIGGGIPSSAEPWEGHARERRDGRSHGLIWFLQDPLLQVNPLHTHTNYSSK